MGKKVTRIPKPFRRQFITQALWVLLLSALTSLVMWAILFLGTLTLFQPANHYEKELPQIFRRADQEGAALLNPGKRSELEAVIPEEGIQYRVVSLSGNESYGTIPEQEVPPKKELIRDLNKSDQQQGSIYMYHPLLNQQGELKGVLIIRYGLSLQSANPNEGPLPTLFLIAAMATPFASLATFAILFGRRLEKRFSPAVRALMEGAKKIEQSDLDFSLGPVGGSQELSAIGSAFERMRSALRSSLEKQWRSEQSRREMVAALAHDLFTPLTLIQGHAEQLSKLEAKEEQRRQRYVETIRSNSRRAIRLLEEMQEATRLELPTFHLRGAEVEVAPFVKEKAEEYRALCMEKEIQLKTEFHDERLDPTEPLYLDDQRLSQVIDNLLANAIRYTPVGGEVKWKTIVKEAGLEMEITDSGPGLSEKDMRFLFDKFYRGDPARTPEEGHAGLGMYIAKTLIEKHGGWITADNAPTGGARFRFGIGELSREEERGVEKD